MGTNCNICSNKCYGVEGYHGSCCSIEERNYIIGPHHDTEEFIKNLSEKLGRGRSLRRGLCRCGTA